MSGGLDRALDLLGTDVVATAVAGFRYLDLANGATVVEGAELTPTAEEKVRLDPRPLTTGGPDQGGWT